MRSELLTEEITVLIPAAGGTRDALGRVTLYPAALALVAGAPIISHIIEYLMALGIKTFRIATRSEYLDKFISVTKRFSGKADFTFIQVDESRTPVETIKILVKGIPLERPVLLNLGDTFCKWDIFEFDPHEIAILVDQVTDSERWATVTLSANGRVERIFEKQVEAPDSFGVCGVYWWRHAKELLHAIENSPVNAEISRLLPIREREVFGVLTKMWIDSDRQDILENSRLTMVQARSFNSIDVDPFRGSVTKRSTNAGKLNQEITYYRDLPEDLKIFFPRMLKYEISEVNPSQELEYYPYPTLSEIYCFEDAPRFIWEKIFHKLARITFEAFASHNSVIKDTTLIAIFVEKSRSRFIKLMDSSYFSDKLLSSPHLIINGEIYLGIEQIFHKAERILKTVDSDNNVLHGDFCLSNIMCDINSTNIKLIDPRGGFEVSSCYGPQIYDIAKLGHSVVGRYDLIITDLFMVKQCASEQMEFTIDIFSRGSHDMVEDVFFSHYLEDKFEPRLVRLLSGLTLLSIPALHLDKPDRALALFLQGVQIANRAIREFE